MAGTKIVRTTATVAIMKVEFKSFRVRMCSKEGQGEALAINVKERDVKSTVIHDGSFLLMPVEVNIAMHE